MAKLLLIKDNKWHLPGKNNIGDVISKRENNHKFEENEKTKFEVVQIPGTLKQIKDSEKSELPEMAFAYWDNVDKEWVKITELTDKKKITNEIIPIWKNENNDYFRYEKPPKYRSRWDGSKFVENITASGNDDSIVVTDRNP